MTATLNPTDTGTGATTVKAPLTRKRSKKVWETPDYCKTVARMIRAAGRRVADADVESLPHLVELRRALEEAEVIAVRGLRQSGYSWAEIAARMETSKQAAQQRWGAKV